MAPLARSTSDGRQTFSLFICGIQPAWICNTHLAFTNPGFWGISPLFFFMLPSHGHLDSKLSLAAQQFKTLNHGNADGKDGRRVLNLA